MRSSWKQQGMSQWNQCITCSGDQTQHQAQLVKLWEAAEESKWCTSYLLLLVATPRHSNETNGHPEYRYPPENHASNYYLLHESRTKKDNQKCMKNLQVSPLEATSRHLCTLLKESFPHALSLILKEKVNIAWVHDFHHDQRNLGNEKASCPN